MNTPQFSNQPIQEEILEQIKKFEHEQKKWKDNYGEVRPPISLDFHGHKLVVSGSRINYSSKWRFFSDFLLDYIPLTFGREWGRFGDGRFGDVSQRAASQFENRLYQNRVSSLNLI